MRITEVVVRFAPAVGGVETTVLELSRRLVRKGHEVTVICADRPTGAPDRIEGIRVVRLPFRHSVGGTHLSRGIVDAVVASRPDVIHAHLPTAWWADSAGWASKRCGAPLVVTYNNDLVGRGVKGLAAALYNRWPLRSLLARAGSVMVPNPRYAGLSPFLSRAGPRLHHIPWGVDLERFTAAPAPAIPPLVVGFLGVLDEHHAYKGLDDLLQAAAIVRHQGLELILVIGGEGPELPRLRSRAAALGLGELAARFAGFIPDAALPEFFRSCHVFALPSRDWRQEGFGLVLLEAMACGRPVLTTPVVGIAGDLRGNPGAVLVPPSSPESLARALSELASAGDFEKRGDAARRLVAERYGWDLVAAAYEKEFLSLVAPLRTTSSASTSWTGNHQQKNRS